MTAGAAMRMRIELSRYKRSPPLFSPPALLASVDHDWIVEGHAAPETVDREWMCFAHYAWWPLPRPEKIPLLYRHGRPAGKVLEVRTDERGLWVKALVSDAEAKRCSYFSVAATVHDFRIRHPGDDKLAHALIINATLDEVSIVNDNPGNPDARILVRHRPTSLAGFDLAIEHAKKLMAHIEAAQRLFREAPAPPPRPKPKPRVPVEPHRATPFGQLIQQMERNQHG